MRIGIDLGGTKTEAIALEPSGDIAFRKRVPTARDYDGTIEMIRDLVGEVKTAVGEASVGIGMPGSPSVKTGLIRNANSTWLNDKPFARDMEAALGQPVRLANDANCLALSETMDGAGAGASTVFAIIIGTGCGGGLVVDGALAEGAHGIAGEWGHNGLPWPRADEVPGPDCWCGLNGCLETWISGSGLEADHERVTGNRLTGREIAASLSGGDEMAKETIDRYTDRLGRGVASVVNLIDPDVIVLGGGVSNIPDVIDALPQIVRRYVFSDFWDAPIRAAKWGDSSGVRGAAWLWPAQ